MIVLSLASNFSQQIQGQSREQTKPDVSLKDETKSTAGAAATAEAPEAEKKTDTLIEAQQEVVKGTIKEIAQDKSYIVVENTKILTPKQFLDDSYLEVGDRVEITAEKTDEGLKAKSYNYIFEDEFESSTLEEEFPTEEKIPEGVGY
jgi:hypothetical protein